MTADEPILSGNMNATQTLSSDGKENTFRVEEKIEKQAATSVPVGISRPPRSQLPRPGVNSGSEFILIVKKEIYLQDGLLKAIRKCLPRWSRLNKHKRSYKRIIKKRFQIRLSIVWPRQRTSIIQFNDASELPRCPTNRNSDLVNCKPNKSRWFKSLFLHCRVKDLQDHCAVLLLVNQK